MRIRTHASATRPVHHRLTVLVAVLVALLAPLATGLPVEAQTARTPAASGNPLGGRDWGIDTHDIVFKTYDTSTGTTRDLLAKLALRPRVFWFTENVPASEIRGKIRDYITKSQAGDRDKLVQLAVFRLWPRTEHRRDEPLTLAERAAYRRWVDNAARGIGSARVALVLEPDLAVSLKGWRPSVRLGLARYATKVFAGLPRTTVYLDAGSSDWLGVPQAVSMLRAAGIRYARGFSLGATHYTSPASEIAYGTQVTAALAKAGFRKHFVVDTSDSGRPFTWTQYWADHPRGDFDNAEHCRILSQRRCVTLGIPPTTNVWRPRRGLSPQRLAQARAHVDAYLWFSRPWFVYAYPAYFDLKRTLAVARTTPF